MPSQGHGWATEHAGARSRGNWVTSESAPTTDPSLRSSPHADEGAFLRSVLAQLQHGECARLGETDS